MMTLTCAISGQTFTITDEDKAYYQTMGVPLPTLCPDERARRRMVWSNQRNLKKRKCSGTGKDIISNFDADSVFPVYDVHHFFSDKWDQNATGRDFDFSRPFFEQFEALMQVAPRPALQRSPEYDENAEYTNYAGKNKNCYLIFDSDKNWDCSYAYSLNNCQNCQDCYRLEDSELCYECVDCAKCYNGRFLQNCENCADSQFLKNCIGCKNCFGSVNLRNKEFYFMNEKLTEEAYKAKLAALDLKTEKGLKGLRSHFVEHAKKYPVRYMEGVQNEDCLGNYLTHCKNAQYCFDCRKQWDCKYVTQGFDTAKSCMDCTEVGDDAELLYECYCMGYGPYNCRFCTHELGRSVNLDYCYFAPYCEDCFGCVGLHHKKFCILNKQYSESEYKALVPKIIEHMGGPRKTEGFVGRGGGDEVSEDPQSGSEQRNHQRREWGEYFPFSLSPFAYNETMAMDNFPLTKEEALKRGFRWDDALDAGAERPFKVQKVDEKFYKDMGLPTPTVHPEVRHLARVALRNPRVLYDRVCGDCGCAVQTTHSPDRPEKVLCETCFQKVVD